MKRQYVLTSVLLLGLLLALTVGLSLAQGPEPPASEADEAGELSPAAVVAGRIPIQGRLTDASGNPLDGDHDVTFRLYDVWTGGTALCSSSRTVSAENGLFSSNMSGSGCPIDGRQLYLGITVGGDAEMTPRRPIYAVPYAYSLRPGAVISTTGYPALHVESTNPSGRGLRAYASATSGTNYGVVGASRSPDGYGGYFYNTGGGTGVYGQSQSTDAVDPPAPGVHGVSDHGDGVRGETSSPLGRAVFARNQGQGIAMYGHSDSLHTSNHLYPTLYLVQQNANGDFVVGANSFWGTRYWRVDRTGKGFFNGGTQVGGADFAEQMDVAGDEATYEPGDVLVISGDADRMVELSLDSFDAAVVGVYSTNPGVLAGAPDTDDPLGGIPVAITGIVPCKVSAENGVVHRGDLLVTAATPGHAMRAGEDPPQGTVLGKALGELEEGSGIILVLVTLQ